MVELGFISGEKGAFPVEELLRFAAAALPPVCPAVTLPQEELPFEKFDELLCECCYSALIFRYARLLRYRHPAA